MRVSQDEWTDEQAMCRVQEHEDHSAFTLIVRRWQMPLHRLAVRMLSDEHRAEDITQEAFSRIFSRRREYRPENRLSTWIWRITINLCHDELRRRRRRPESPLEWTGSGADDVRESGEGPGLDYATASATPAEHAALADSARQVRQALRELPELYRSVVILRHYEGLKFTEIAAVLDIPEGTVKSRMVEGLARLAKSLGPLLADRPVISAAPSASPSSVSVTVSFPANPQLFPTPLSS